MADCNWDYISKEGIIDMVNRLEDDRDQHIERAGELAEENERLREALRLAMPELQFRHDKGDCTCLAGEECPLAECLAALQEPQQ